MINSSLVVWIFPVVIFIAVALAVLGIMQFVVRSPVRNRLDKIVGPGALVSSERQASSDWVQSLSKLAEPFAKLSAPEGDADVSGIRRRFIQAGLPHPMAPSLFFALKTLLAIGLPLLGWMVYSFVSPGTPLLKMYPLLAILALIGYYGCNFGLNRMIERRQREIFETFPDALDLLTVCVESGLGLDAAIARVSGEIAVHSPIVSKEFALVSLDLRAGSSKERALRGLALRTGVDDIDTLVAVLIQSEKFGTSVGTALRIHSDMLRTKRMQRAEEKAAKIAVKLLFPLIFCIFPALIVVLLGPSIIFIAKVLPKMVGGN